MLIRRRQFTPKYVNNAKKKNTPKYDNIAPIHPKLFWQWTIDPPTMMEELENSQGFVGQVLSIAPQKCPFFGVGSGQWVWGVNSILKKKILDWYVFVIVLK